MKLSRSEFVTVRGLRLHVRHWGSEGAPKLFMLHGWMDQLEDEGFAARRDGTWDISWDALYAVLAHPEHAVAAAMLEPHRLTEMETVTDELAEQVDKALRQRLSLC